MSHFGRSRLHEARPPPTGDIVGNDIIHLHWISRWVDLPSFLGSIPRHVLIVWTIHDMSALAGGSTASSVLGWQS
jgi:hypothetical protein